MMVARDGVERFPWMWNLQVTDNTKDTKDSKDRKDGFCVRFVCVFSAPDYAIMRTNIPEISAAGVRARSFTSLASCEKIAPVVPNLLFGGGDPASTGGGLCAGIEPRIGSRHDPFYR